MEKFAEDPDNLSYQFSYFTKERGINLATLKRAVKRGFDLLFTLLFCLFAAPLFLIIAVAVYLSSNGSIFYSHERLGREGKPFHCYKFRTMYPDAQEKLKQLLKDQPELRKEWETSFKLKNDPRITPFGQFLRKTSLDELPQLWNILKGDLSIVGPRPVTAEEIEKYYQVKKHLILSVRPGLTGLWQISGRSDLDCYEKRVALDEYYVKNQNFFLDLKIILKTIPALLAAKGAY